MKTIIAEKETLTIVSCFGGVKDFEEEYEIPKLNYCPRCGRKLEKS